MQRFIGQLVVGLREARAEDDRMRDVREMPTPVVGGLSLTSITSGSTSMCAVTATGTGYFWGSTTRGATVVNLPMPVPRPVFPTLAFRRP